MIDEFGRKRRVTTVVRGNQLFLSTHLWNRREIINVC